MTSFTVVNTGDRASKRLKLHHDPSRPWAVIGPSTKLRPTPSMWRYKTQGGALRKARALAISDSSNEEVSNSLQAMVRNAFKQGWVG